MPSCFLVVTLIFSPRLIKMWGCLCKILDKLTCLRQHTEANSWICIVTWGFHYILIISLFLVRFLSCMFHISLCFKEIILVLFQPRESAERWWCPQPAKTCKRHEIKRQDRSWIKKEISAATVMKRNVLVWSTAVVRVVNSWITHRGGGLWEEGALFAYCTPLMKHQADGGRQRLHQLWICASDNSVLMKPW